MPQAHENDSTTPTAEVAPLEPGTRFLYRFETGVVDMEAGEVVGEQQDYLWRHGSGAPQHSMDPIPVEELRRMYEARESTPEPAAPPNGAEHWLDKMPAARCGETRTVRRGRQFGIVTCNTGGVWRVVLLDDPEDVADDLGPRSESGEGTAEAAGWRHALCHHSGFAYVLDEVERILAGRQPQVWRGPLTAADRVRITSLALSSRRRLRETDDADRLLVALAFAEVTNG